MFSFLNVDSDLGHDILLEKLTSETRDEFEKHSLHYTSGGWGFHTKPVAWGQVNRLGVGGS